MLYTCTNMAAVGVKGSTPCYASDKYSPNLLRVGAIFLPRVAFCKTRVCWNSVFICRSLVLVSELCASSYTEQFYTIVFHLYVGQNNG